VLQARNGKQIVSKRTQRIAGEIDLFIRQYARKRVAGQDPNDRRYDRNLEQHIRHMKPEELDALMREEPKPAKGIGAGKSGKKK